MSLRRQMFLLIVVPTLVIYIAILGLTTLITYGQAKSDRQRIMTQLATGYATRFDAQLRAAALIAESNAGFMQTGGPLPDAKIYELLASGIRRSPMVYGAAMAFEPGVVKPANVLFSPYVCRDPPGADTLRQLNIDQSVYDWYRDPQYTWFTEPKKLNKPVWSDPYFDKGAGNILMATYSVPFELNGKFGGIATVDIDLPRLRQTVARGFAEDLDFVILSANGKFVYDPDPSRILERSIYELATEKNNPALADLGKRMLERKSGMDVIENWDSAQTQWVFYAPIPSTNWVFATRFPEEGVLANVRYRTLATAAALGATLLLIVLCIVFVSRHVTDPIVRLKEKVVEVGAGNLDVHIDPGGASSRATTSELQQLTDSFNAMTAQLRSHVDRLAEERTARVKLEHGLALASQIQQSLLPSCDPAHDLLDIAGRSRYCDETGGDYYDFIDISHPTRSATMIAVGDVTGHGIASALVMATARAALRVQATESGQFATLLTKVNRLLAADNHNQFMTMSLLVIDPEQSMARWASAGHDPAIVYRPSDDSFHELTGSNIPLGIEPETEYEEFQSNDVRSGDILILGTDGIWEARNPARDMFGKNRLRDVIRAHRDGSASQIAQAIERAIEDFRGAALQLDDITFVAIRVK
jgi:phosphoserine phosphatase RsbU/P